MNKLRKIKYFETKLRLIKSLNMFFAVAMTFVLLLSIGYFFLNFSLYSAELQSLSVRMVGWMSIILGLIFLQGITGDVFVNYYKNFAEAYGVSNRQAHSTKNIVKIYRSFLNTGGPFFQGRELYSSIFSLSILTTSFFLILSGVLWVWVRYAFAF